MVTVTPGEVGGTMECVDCCTSCLSHSSPRFQPFAVVMFVKADKTQRGKIGEGTLSQKKLANLIVHTSRSMKKNSDERSTVELKTCKVDHLEGNRGVP